MSPQAKLCLIAMLVSALTTTGYADPGSSNSNAPGSQSNSQSRDPGLTTAEISSPTTSQMGVGTTQAMVAVCTVAFFLFILGGFTFWVVWASTASATQLANFEHYLRENQSAVEQALAMGAGVAMDDLADIFNIPIFYRPRFGQVMRGARGEFAPLLHDNDGITAETTLRFAQTAFLHMLQDPLLSGPILGRGEVSVRVEIEGW